MVKPLLAERLKKGDTIGIVAPSSRIYGDYAKYLTAFSEYAKTLGFTTAYGKYLFTAGEFGAAAATPKQRAEDINAMFKDKHIKAIWCAHGGDTANQILSYLDYAAIKKNPKIFIGMSDNDVILNAIHKKTGLITFNGSDPRRGRELEFDFPYTQNSFAQRMMHGKKEITAVAERKTMRAGKAQGTLIGCNIKCLLKLAGTPYFPNYKGAILCVEGHKKDIGEALYNLAQLKQMGILDHIKGIIVGRVYGFDELEKKDDKGNKVLFEDIVLHATREYAFPILKVYEVGHRCPMAFLPIGATVEMDATKKTLKIVSEFLK